MSEKHIQIIKSYFTSTHPKWSKNMLQNAYVNKLTCSLKSGYNENKENPPIHYSKSDKIRFTSLVKAVTLLKDNKPIEFVVTKSNKCLILIKHQKAAGIYICTFKLKKIRFLLFLHQI